MKTSKEVVIEISMSLSIGERARLHLLGKEFERLNQVSTDPTLLLEDLQMYINEPDDEALKRLFDNVYRQSLLWNRVFTLAGLRSASNPNWEKCEPVLRAFWERVAGRVFMVGDDESAELMRKKAYKQIFGEEELHES